MHGRTLCVQADAERQSLRYHAERGNDQIDTEGRTLRYHAERGNDQYLDD